MAMLALMQVAHAVGLPWEIWESPARFAALDADDIVVEHSSACPNGCRYDRSNQGPESLLDNPYPLRWMYRDGNEVVVFDERGPGALTRFWMTTGDGVSRCIDPAIRVRFRIDGAITPVLDLPLAALFDGSSPPFTAPLVADRLSSSGGYVSRMPIAYAQSLRISLVNAESAPSACDPSGWRLLWYQFNAHRLKPGTAVTSFTATADEPELRAYLSTPPGADPWHGMLATQPFAQILSAPTSWDVATRNGSGWLRGIRLDVAPQDRPNVRLRLWFDAVLAVDMSVADFFAASPPAPARSLLFGEDSGGVLYAWWPMPYANEARVQLVVTGPVGTPIPVSGSLSFDNAPPPTDGSRFHAVATSQCVASSQMSVFSIRGAGKLVGLAARYRADGVVDRAYLEGDERVYVDDAVAPSWYGTGVEDLHDGGFYFDQGAFLRELSGASAIDPDGTGETSAYRLFATDPVVYASELRFDQEAGLSPAQPLPMCASHVVFGYRRERPLVVSYDRFEVGDAVAAAAHAYTPPAGTTCTAVSGLYADEPPTARVATVCRHASGGSRFRFDLGDAAGTLRLRRTFDVGAGVPGSIAGAPAADVLVDGLVVGRFPPAASNPARRWQQQEILLASPAQPGTLDIEIVPVTGAYAADFSESAWELRGGWIDALFADGFEIVHMASSPP